MTSCCKHCSGGLRSLLTKPHEIFQQSPEVDMVLLNKMQGCHDNASEEHSGILPQATSSYPLLSVCSRIDIFLSIYFIHFLHTPMVISRFLNDLLRTAGGDVRMNFWKVHVDTCPSPSFVN